MSKVMTVHLRVELMPFLRRKQNKNVFDMKMPDDSTVEEVLSELGFGDDETSCLMVSVNDRQVYLEEKLKDNDTVWVGIVIGGG